MQEPLGREVVERAGRGARPPRPGLSSVIHWLPAAGAAAYAGLLAVELRSVLAAVYSNSDAASPPVLAQCLTARACASGQVVLGHIAYYTTLWFDLLASGLPDRRLVWQAGPILLWVAGLALLAWTVWRLSGGWSAATATAVGLAASSSTLYATVAQAFHGTTWFTTILLGSFLVLRPQPRSLAVLLVSVIAGVDLASDPLLGLAAAPLLAAPLLLWIRSRDRAYLGTLGGAAVVVTLSTAIALGTTLAMRAAGFVAAPVDAGLADPAAIPGRSLRLLDDVAALVNVGALEQADPGRLAVRLVAVAAALVAIALVIRGVGHELRSPAVALHMAYWGLLALTLCAAFVAGSTPLGAGTPSARYLIGLVYAAAAALPIAVGGSRRARTVAAIAVSALCTLSCLALARGSLAAAKARVPIVVYGGAIVATLEKLGIQRGYADYWQAAPLSWRSGGRIVIAPIDPCQRRICPYPLNSISGWYEPRPDTRSFLLSDRSTGIASPALHTLGRPLDTDRFGTLRLRIYGYDIARRFALAPPPERQLARTAPRRARTPT